MKNKKEEKELKKRQPYEKPAFWSISLVADQVLAIGCKSEGIEFSKNDIFGCVLSGCSTLELS